jgi:hypothetical protein
LAAGGLMGLALIVLAALSPAGAEGVQADPVDLTPTASVYLPLVMQEEFRCPATSSNTYTTGIAYQADWDDPVRPAYNHADKNLEMRSWDPNTYHALKRELISYNVLDRDPRAPQFATMFRPHRVPELVGFYQVHHWNWAPSPIPGTQAGVITFPAVTALGLGMTQGEPLHVPESGYEISPGNAAEVLVLFADADSITFKFTREDSAATGYTLHVGNICTDPNLLALYDALDDPAGPRYVYKPLEERPYAYSMVEMAEGQAFGVARGDEIVLAIVDTGSFLDPRSCYDWWEYRPGYTGTCPWWLH